MNTYYIGDMPITDELYHHGIQGQKWGVRRYQNEDGTLTAEGKKRYGRLGEHANEHGLVRRLATGDFKLLGVKRYADKQEETYKSKMKEAQRSGNERRAEMFRKEYESQRAANIDRDKYISRTSTGKLVLQNLLLGPIGSTAYQTARERGEERWQAAIPGMIANVPYVGIIGSAVADTVKNKRAYGGSGII